MARQQGLDHVRRSLATLDPEVLRALVVDIHERVPEARALIMTSLSPAKEGGTKRALDPYRRRIIAAMRQAGRVDAPPDLTRARRAIRDYRARTHDLLGAADLLISFLDEAIRASNRLDIPPASLFDSVHAGCDDLRDLLRGVPKADRPSNWVDRIRNIERQAPQRPGLSSALSALAAGLNA